MRPIHTLELDDDSLERLETSAGIEARPNRLRAQIIVVIFAAAVSFGCLVSPPSLMDDVDAVQAQIARNMIHSGDWVTPRLDGVPYMEKAPLKYWMIAGSFLLFGERDWAARIPGALSVVLLCWLVFRFGEWAFGERAGMYAGLALATSAGLFLFTRVLIPDCILTLAITAAGYAMVRLLEEGEKKVRWPLLFWASLAAGVLLKGLIGVVFPVAAGAVYLLATRRFFQRQTWTNFRPLGGLILFMAIAAPWHVLAATRNPPMFDFTMHSESGSYHGFFWFYFINEQLLRFLNKRYPHDYNTVPRLYFWLLHLIWLFPWSLYLPAVFKLDYLSHTRASRVRLLALCWIGAVLIFFSLSTTQEYYSLPCYPALALVIGSALASEDKTVAWSTRVIAVIAGIGLVAVASILYLVRAVSTPGDISAALTEHPQAYTFSLGHLTDITLRAFAYLRLPLAIGAAAFAIGGLGTWRGSTRRAVFGFALMMVVFFQAARLALVRFDPYLSSRPLAEALVQSPPGQLIVDDPYWEFSSVFFYSNRNGLILNGRRNNLEYGSYASGAPDVFIGDPQFVKLWKGPGRCYVVALKPELEHLAGLVGSQSLRAVAASGGKYLFSNQ